MTNENKKLIQDTIMAHHAISGKFGETTRDTFREPNTFETILIKMGQSFPTFPTEKVLEHALICQDCYLDALKNKDLNEVKLEDLIKFYLTIVK